MHSLWSYNIFGLVRSVMDKFLVRTPMVVTEATGEYPNVLIVLLKSDLSK